MKEHGIIMQAHSVLAIQADLKTETRRVLRPQPYSTPLFECNYTHKDIDMAFANEERMCEGLAEVSKYKVGDRLWVRETWADTNGENGPMISYRAGGDRFLIDECYPVDYSRYPGCLFSMWCGDLRRGEPGHKWRNPRFMPRWASRITLEITQVRIQRLQTISEEDAHREGIYYDPESYECEWMTPSERGRKRVKDFAILWDSINGKPQPVYVTRGDRKALDHYVSYPWEEGTYETSFRGKKHYVYGNPFVTAITFKRGSDANGVERLEDHDNTLVTTENIPTEATVTNKVTE